MTDASINDYYGINGRFPLHCFDVIPGVDLLFVVNAIVPSNCRLKVGFEADHIVDGAGGERRLLV